MGESSKHQSQHAANAEIAYNGNERNWAEGFRNGSSWA